MNFHVKKQSSFKISKDIQRLSFDFTPDLVRKKIESIITKCTPHPDPDCPDDEESVRFWVSLGGRMSAKETTSVTATAESGIETTPEVMQSLLGGSTADVGPNLSLAAGTVGNRPALKSLLDIANAEPAASAAPAAKAKAKTKAKAKARVSSQVPKTPAEQRQAIRTLVQTSIQTFCSKFGSNFWFKLSIHSSCF